MDVEQLAPLLVLHADLVEVVAAPVLGGARLQATLGLICGECIRHGLIGVVDAPRDERPVRIPLEELDDHLLPDARDVDRTPCLPGPGGRDPDPTGAVLVLGAESIPVELDLHPPVLVGPDFLAGLPHHECGLGAVNPGSPTLPGGSERNRVRHGKKSTHVLDLCRIPREVVAGLAPMHNLNQ